MTETTKASGINTLAISGVVVEARELRYTPGGIPVWEGRLHHTAEVFEAGAVRKLEFDFPAIAFAEAALALAKTETETGKAIQIKGFLSPRSVRTQRLVVHITEFKN